jgi:hypothetical protein
MSRSELDLDRLEYYTSLEAVAAKKLENEGFIVLDAGECKICNNGRMGHHVKISEDLFDLIGHLDRRVILPDERQLPVEIKSLGPTSWKLFESSLFEEFKNYAFQECCYLEHEKSPGIYWVMNRDTGKVLKYIVNDFKNEYNFPGFEKIVLPITYPQIVDKLNSVEIDVADNKLSDPAPNEDCHWCLFKYLCSGNNSKVTVFVDDSAVKEAVELYKSAKTTEDVCKTQKQNAVNALIGYAKSSNNEKFKVNGVSFSYHGMKYTTSIDDDKMARLLRSYTITDSEGKKIIYDDLAAQVEKRSKSFDSYTIKIIETPEK